MFKELGLSLIALSSLNGVRANNTRSHVVNEDGMAITYKYETNEVESVNDLVVGNIYHIENLNYDDLALNTRNLNMFQFFNLSYVRYDNNNNTITIEQSNVSDNNYISLYASGTNTFAFAIYNSSNQYLIGYLNVNSDLTPSLSFDFIFHSSTSYLNNFIDKISICENVPIESVERVYPSNIFGFVSEFIDENVLSGIPNIDSVAYTIGGQEITMRSWLNTTICLVLACLLIGFLLWFIRYLFRLFGGLLH